MRYLLDPTLAHGRVVISKDAAVIAIAPSVDALVLISHALVVGDELRANPTTMWWVHAWERREKQTRTGL